MKFGKNKNKKRLKKKTYVNNALLRSQKDFSAEFVKLAVDFLGGGKLDGRVLGVKAPTGVGKTTSVIQLIKSYAKSLRMSGVKVLFLTERVSSRDAVRYSVDVNQISDVTDVECYQSITSLEDLKKKYYFIVMDEFASYTTDATFSNTVGKTISIIKELQSLKIMISSNLDEEFNKRIFAGKEYKHFVFRGKYTKNLIIEKQYPFEKQLEYTVKNFKKGKNIIIIRNNDTEQNKKLKSRFLQMGFSAYMITANGGKYTMQKPEEELLKTIKRSQEIPSSVDVILTTSVLDTSVNINVGDKKCDYLINNCFNEDTISQIAGRTRSEKHFRPTTLRISIHPAIAESRLKAAVNKIKHAEKEIAEIEEMKKSNLTATSSWDTYDDTNFDADTIQYLCKINALHKDVVSIQKLKSRMEKNPKDFYILPHLMKNIFDLVNPKIIFDTVLGLLTADASCKKTGVTVYSKMKKIRTFLLGHPKALVEFDEGMFDAYTEEKWVLDKICMFLGMSGVNKKEYEVQEVLKKSKKGFFFKDFVVRFNDLYSESVIGRLVSCIGVIPIAGFDEAHTTLKNKMRDLLNTDRPLEQLFA